MALALGCVVVGRGYAFQIEELDEWVRISQLVERVRKKLCKGQSVYSSNRVTLRAVTHELLETKQAGYYIYRGKTITFRDVASIVVPDAERMMPVKRLHDYFRGCPAAGQLHVLVSVSACVPSNGTIGVAWRTVESSTTRYADLARQYGYGDLGDDTMSTQSSDDWSRGEPDAHDADGRRSQGSAYFVDDDDEMRSRSSTQAQIAAFSRQSGVGYNNSDDELDVWT